MSVVTLNCADIEELRANQVSQFSTYGKQDHFTGAGNFLLFEIVKDSESQEESTDKSLTEWMEQL
jgi:hypothetical protein